MIIWAACCQSTSAVANSVISFATLTNIVKVAENKTKQKTAITTTKMCYEWIPPKLQQYLGIPTHTGAHL